MKRQRATELLQEMLGNLEQGRRPLDLVDEVYVFGSYARGALEPGDLDVSVVHRTDTDFAEDVVSALMYGRDPMADMKRALKGNRRGIQFQFNQNDQLPPGSEPQLLWKRGDTPAAALDRLHAIKADPNAGRAPRDAMIEQFDGLDRWIPLPVRARLIDLLDAGAIEIHRIELPDGDPSSPAAATALARRWKTDSPLRRAAAAAVHYVEEASIAAKSVWVQGRALDPTRRDYGAGALWINLGWYDFNQLTYRLRDGAQSLEVVRPTRTQPLHALHITVRDAAALPIL
ncbi:nucleotidyltransferase-like protein [Streptomyces puniciscabiei]|uniref:Nucleotidyltransferase-like protein n=1 Tax=Streptomyces puniciscabiei TaxID=164348 RepID=A0A542UIT8_9ACTN|nr:nucleotidyltransferase domain-containing protein [Streptomyces puniciscabiei]TQK98972.1 nucleotidyltransferase-like protein [Streptomyces puniciscabiei]